MTEQKTKKKVKKTAKKSTKKAMTKKVTKKSTKKTIKKETIKSKKEIDQSPKYNFVPMSNKELKRLSILKSIKSSSATQCIL